MNFQRLNEDAELQNHQLKSTCNNVQRMNAQLLAQIEQQKAKLLHFREEVDTLKLQEKELGTEVEELTQQVKSEQYRSQIQQDES